ncbi:MAG: ATP-binding protein [Gammaproteobacteria bacterium]|nr:ATP-binding protein [Gammaproteobacteria bacterium]
MDAADKLTPEQLGQAFEIFNNASRDLESAYRVLETRIDHLTGELEQARALQQREAVARVALADRLQTLLAALPGGVVVLDGNGIISSTNPAARQLLGEPLEGEPWYRVLHRCFELDMDDDQELKLRNDSWVTVETSDLGTTPGQIILVNDVTELRAMRQKTELNKRLASMGEMAARLAHQIRTPLSSALLYVSRIRKSAPGEVAAPVERVYQSMKQIETMVADMLGFVRYSHPVTSTVDMAEIMNELLEGLRPIADQHGCTIDFQYRKEQKILVTADRQALLGAFQNIAVNAIQICGHGGEVRMQSSITPEGNAVLTFEDNGPGIEQAIKDRIFEPFFTRRANGVGLGLSVVKRVVDSHHGTISATSSPGQGSCFRIELPTMPGTKRNTDGEEVCYGG